MTGSKVTAKNQITLFEPVNSCLRISINAMSQKIKNMPINKTILLRKKAKPAKGLLTCLLFWTGAKSACCFAGGGA